MIISAYNKRDRYPRSPMCGYVGTMQVFQEQTSMWLYESVTEIDLKINKALHKAKRSIMEYNNQGLKEKANINAAGQQAIGADVRSEQIFFKTLINEGLSGTMYSEESGVKSFGEPSEDDPFSIVCIIDPLDGSANYLKGVPFGCISLGYGPYKSDPVLKDLTTASIMNLYGNEEFYAESGIGAYKNGNELKRFEDLSIPPFSERTIQMSYYAYSNRASQINFQAEFSLRSLGSAAWELALVADNRNDAFADIRGVLKTHDFAGAKIIIEALGGNLQFLDISKEEADYLPLDDFTSGYSVVTSLDDEFLDFLMDKFNAINYIEPKA